MKKKGLTIGMIIAFLLGLFFLLLLWWSANKIMTSNNLHYLPAPKDIFTQIGDFLFGSNAGETYVAVGYSFLKLIIGFGFSFLLAALLGTISAIFPLFSSFEKSHIILLRSIPTAGIALILGVAFWLEIPSLQPYIPSVLIFLVAFPIVYQAFLDGINSLSKDERDSLRLEGAERKIFTIFNVYWPDAKEYIALSVKQGIGLSFKVAVMSEVVTNSGTHEAGGIGTLIGKAIQEEANLNAAISYSLIAVLVMLVLDLLAWVVNRLRKTELNSF